METDVKSHGSEPEAWLQRVCYLFGFRKTWAGAQPFEEAIPSTDYENQLALLHLMAKFIRTVQKNMITKNVAKRDLPCVCHRNRKRGQSDFEWKKPLWCCLHHGDFAFLRNRHQINRGSVVSHLDEFQRIAAWPILLGFSNPQTTKGYVYASSFSRTSEVSF